MDAHYHYSYPVCILFWHCKYCSNILIWEEIACISVVYFIAVMFYVIAFTIHVLCSIYVSINSDFPCLKIGKKKIIVGGRQQLYFKSNLHHEAVHYRHYCDHLFSIFIKQTFCASYPMFSLNYHLSYTRIRSYSFTH